MSELKFCFDCKWLQIQKYCSHPEAVRHDTNLVEGRKEFMDLAYKLRMSHEKCGFEGKLWEAKP